MRMSMAEVADKYTILLIKKENGLEVDDIELSAYKEEASIIDCAELRGTNELMWAYEDLITKELQKVEPNLIKIGDCCYSLRTLNIRRIKAKNKIAKEHSEYLEEKNY